MRILSVDRSLNFIISYILIIMMNDFSDKKNKLVHDYRIGKSWNKKTHKTYVRMKKQILFCHHIEKDVATLKPSLI